MLISSIILLDFCRGISVLDRFVVVIFNACLIHTRYHTVYTDSLLDNRLMAKHSALFICLGMLSADQRLVGIAVD